MNLGTGHDYDNNALWQSWRPGKRTTLQCHLPFIILAIDREPDPQILVISGTEKVYTPY
jgi:hypothetical protein